MPFINLFATKTSINNVAFSERIDEARQLIANADHILIGAGSGLSTAAGLDYAGDDFQREFKPWIEKYGIKDLYSSSFYPFETEEERWAYWAKHIWFTRYRIGGTSLYKELLQLVAGKDYFVITTNTDAQFLKSGFEPKRIFYTQGDYAYLQDAEGVDKHLYYNEAKVMQMLAHTTDCRISTEMVPRDPVNGHQMAVNLRCDDTFVEDMHWHEMQKLYEAFVNRACRERLVLLEFGVGFNTPVIIRFPFERLATQFDNISLIRFNKDYPQLTEGVPHLYICFREPIDKKLLKKLGSSDL